MSLVSDLTSSRELLANLTRREVKGKYKRTVLGQLWSLVNPLAQMVIFTAVFSFILRMQPAAGDPSGLDVFALWLLCALLPWAFFTNVVNGGMGSIVGNENLIKKVAFPRVTLPVSNALSVGFTWSLEMLVLLVALVIAGSNAWAWVPVVLVAMVVLLAFALGVSLMLSIANVYFRDTQHFVGILLQAWFYATPIVYPVSLVAEQSAKIGPLFGSVTLLDLYRLNPMERFSEVFRNLLYDNRWPSLESSLMCLGWAVLSLGVGAYVFRRHQTKLAEAL